MTRIKTPYGIFDSVEECTMYILDNPEILADFMENNAELFEKVKSEMDIVAMDKAGFFDID
jgi:hypothetical protein